MCRTFHFRGPTPTCLAQGLLLRSRRLEVRRVEERPGLVIESEEGIQQALISVLRTLGHAWVLTNSAEEALAALAENDFLFTWLNLRLNGTDGRDLVRSLRLQGGDPGPGIGFADGIGDPGR